jgi:hypothetical protein
MEHFSELIVVGFFGAVGIACLIYGFIGKDFHFSRLGSVRPGPPMPTRFARPFCFLLGVFFIWGAFGLWKQS